MYSFPLFEKLKAALPEFEQVAAFQAGGWRLSVRRATVDPSPRPLRSEFVTGNYFSTFGIRSFGGRMIGAFKMVALGLLLGVPLAIGAGRLMAAQLYGIAHWDPFSLSVAIVALASSAFVAAIIPAGRAAAIEPIKALRME
jgi:hypothetical protein